jgi:hypothetical protein
MHCHRVGPAAVLSERCPRQGSKGTVFYVAKNVLTVSRERLMKRDQRQLELRPLQKDV